LCKISDAGISTRWGRQRSHFPASTEESIVQAATDSPTGSGNSGDLRYCVNKANLAANAGNNAISFAPGVAPATITLTFNETNNPGAFGPTALVIVPGDNLT
jgi:hypothetical protein